MAIGLTMAPSAFDRQTKEITCTKNFVKLASRLISAGMIPLCIPMSLDLYIITLMITGHQMVAVSTATAAFVFLSVLWFLIPFLHNLRNRPRAIDGY
ncbi:MAG: hypothetical protein K2X93_05270 [Candidatus Obscuribacterales bacterium]|nr:hypothetical protein [Candidatus Obscuribacterales bacterium]